MTRPAPRLLMCRPDHYGIEYEINPWMDRSRKSTHHKARQQWEALVAIFESLGARIEYIEPIEGLPDMVFTANAGLICNNLFVSSRFGPKERQGESEHFERWFHERGWHVVCLATPLPFEGAGDALYCGKTLYAGYRHRSDIRAHRQLGNLLGCHVLSLELADPHFYHLDTCFCPLTADLAIYYPPAFDEYAQKVLTEHVGELVPVGAEDARHFGCNAVVLGRDVVVNAASDELVGDLHARGYTVHQTPMTEFLKAGGSAKCLTLRLDGEEAAIW